MAYMLRRYNYALVLSLIFTIMHATEIYAADTDRGAVTYLKYCAGCHGFEGIANYRYSPSFSLGDRLQKDDQELLQSVLNGKNGMPAWGNILPVEELRNAISYLRLMHRRLEMGLPPRQVEMPDIYYFFKPVGEANMDWLEEDVIVPGKFE